MDKAELQRQLRESHFQFIQFIQSLSEAEFLYAPQGKWTSGQQVDHLIKSVSPVKTAFSLPKFTLKLLFGKANRHSRTYDALVEKYRQKLVAGGKSTSRFFPSMVKYTERERLLTKLKETVSALSDRINRFSENDLETHILPHPLLCKLTLREMLYFTIYHVQHHERNIHEALKSKS